MNRERRMFAVAVSLLTTLNLVSLAINPVSAEHGKWEIWEGTQTQGEIVIDEIKIAGRNVEIYGQITMYTIYTTPQGYQFGNVQVGYEVINYIKIYGLDDEVLGLLKLALTYYQDPTEIFYEYPELVGALYCYPRFGRFTWYTWSDGEVGTGIFRTDGELGRLWVSGAGFVAEGEFWPLLNGDLYHTGLYIVQID